MIESSKNKSGDAPFPIQVSYNSMFVKGGAELIV